MGHFHDGPNLKPNHSISLKRIGYILFPINAIIKNKPLESITDLFTSLISPETHDLLIALSFCKRLGFLEFATPCLLWNMQRDFSEEDTS